MFIAVLAFVAVLGLLIFVHEVGHFIVAKRAGMRVEEFGFGFPPRIIGVHEYDGRWRIVRGRSVSGSTVYSLNWIPLGGFVRIRGEHSSDASDPESFAAKPYAIRAAVLVAGVAMNLVLAVALFTTVYAVGVRQVIDGVPSGAQVRDRKMTVIGVLDGSPASAVGLQPGDAISAIDGASFRELTPLQQYIRAHADRELQVIVERDGATRTVAVRPASLPGIAQPGIGVQLVATGIMAFPLHLALWEGVRTTGSVAVEIVRAIGGLLRGLVMERAVTADIAGPVGIAVMTGQVAQLGIIHLAQFTAVLSTNLALLNVLPLPALDGGRLLLLILEAIRRRSLGKKVENAIHAVGFAILLLIVVAVTYRDIATFGGGIWSSVKSTVGF